MTTVASKAKSLITLMNLQAMFKPEEFMDRCIPDSFIKDHPDQLPRLTVEIDASIAKIYEKMINVILSVYGEDEIDAMISFYQTPIGQSVLSKNEVLGRRMTLIGLDLGQDIDQALEKILIELKK